MGVFRKDYPEFMAVFPTRAPARQYQAADETVCKVEIRILPNRKAR